MTRKQALADAIAKVEAEEIDQAPFWKVWLPESESGILAYTAKRAAVGSLDAAKALHEAVLQPQDMPMICRTDHAQHDWVVNIGNGDSQFNPDPARAWLLAIIRALHSMEHDT